MNKIILLLTILFIVSCKHGEKTIKRIPVAAIGNTFLYYDELPQLVQPGVNEADSVALVQNYINKWAKRELLLQKAEENLSPRLKDEISKQLEESRTNLIIYQYQRQMMLEKMDTVISENELENYYSKNEKSFVLNSNIVKALFIKLPIETPALDKIRKLAKSDKQADLQALESACYQFAEKFDDFNEDWVPMSRISVEWQQNIENEEDLLKRNTFYETNDGRSVYMLSIRDYRLRQAVAPFEYVKEDIKRIIWNTRRFEFMQSIENGIYNEALKKNSFKIY